MCEHCPGIVDGEPRGEVRMKRLFSRTSITIDEAVYILLGQSDGPIEFEPIDDSEEAEANVPVFCLQEALEDEPGQDALTDRANAYLCEIQDEINKGEQSVLKVDVALSNRAYTYITLHSFKEWVKCRQLPAVGQPDERAATDTDRIPVNKEKKQRDKGKRQNEAIVAALLAKEYKLKALPPSPKGHPGVRAEIYEVLRDSPLFGTRKVYEHAWDRCFDLDHLAYEAEPTPPQKED